MDPFNAYLSLGIIPISGVKWTEYSFLGHKMARIMHGRLSDFALFIYGKACRCG